MVTKKLKHFEYGCHTDKGKIKSGNYDGFASFDSPNGRVFVLCDGRDERGLKARDIALERIRYFMEKEYVDNPFEAVESALIYTGGYIYEYLRKNDEWHEEMAASCLCVLIRDNKIYYSSLGNCHVYLFNGKRLYQLTQETVSGISSDQERISSQGWIGSEKVPSPFVCDQALVPLNDDMILMCTDGLYEAVKERSIKKILADPMPVYTKACRLVDMANEAGGYDNITVQIVSFYNLDHDERKFVPAEPPKKEELPKTVDINITGNPVWNIVIIGAVLIIAGYMFYDLFLFNPRPAVDIEKQEEVDTVDTIPETENLKDRAEDQPVNIEAVLNHFAPEDTVYRVQSGDSWSSIYSKFAVCSWFIRQHEQNTGKFDSAGNPVAGRTIYIPLRYSANPQYNPRFYDEFTTDKVGGACQNASKEFIENFHETLKQKYIK